MQLNYEYMRKVLLSIESCDSEKYTIIDDIDKLEPLSQFSTEYIHNILDVCRNAGLLYDNPFSFPKFTFKGYELLERIRSDKLWKEIKEVTRNIDVISIEIIKKTADEIIFKRISDEINK